MTTKPHRVAQLRKKAKRGFRGYPIATIAFYGPDDRLATKVVVGIVADESNEVVELKRWFSAESDARSDFAIGEEIKGFLELHGVRSVAMTDGIIGCVHEEGIDYPAGHSCPMCPYWAGRDRFTRDRIH